MTHNQRIQAIRAQMKDALRTGDMTSYLMLVEQLGTVLMTEAQRVETDEVHARMTNAYRGGW